LYILWVVTRGDAPQEGEELMLDYGAVYWTGRKDKIVS